MNFIMPFMQRIQHSAVIVHTTVVCVCYFVSCCVFFIALFTVCLFQIIRRFFSKLVNRQCFPPFAQNAIELKEFTWTSLRTHNIHTTTNECLTLTVQSLLLCVRHIYEPFIRVLQQRKIILCFFLLLKKEISFFFVRRFSAYTDLVYAIFN